jgi:hypothetical protein
VRILQAVGEWWRASSPPPPTSVGLLLRHRRREAVELARHAADQLADAADRLDAGDWLDAGDLIRRARTDAREAGHLAAELMPGVAHGWGDGGTIT